MGKLFNKNEKMALAAIVAFGVVTIIGAVAANASVPQVFTPWSFSAIQSDTAFPVSKARQHGIVEARKSQAMGTESEDCFGLNVGATENPVGSGLFPCLAYAPQ